MKSFVETNEIHVSAQPNARESMFERRREEKNLRRRVHKLPRESSLMPKRKFMEKLFVYNLAISLSSLVLCGANGKGKSGVDILAEQKCFSCGILIIVRRAPYDQRKKQ